MENQHISENGFEIDINITKLLEKEVNGTLCNEDFTELWSNLCIYPISLIEYIIHNSAHTHAGYDRDQAIIYGLLTRLFKLLCFQRRLVCKRLMTISLAGFFERMLLEQIINLQYYIQNYNNKALLDSFRLDSLKPEAAFEDNIHNDNSETYAELHSWQQQFLDSIHSTYQKTNTTYEIIKKRRKSSPSIFEKFSDTGNKRLYEIAYRTKCHDIHGDWVDLLQNYLTFDEVSLTFSPNFNEYEADLRQLNPPLLICCDMLKIFVRIFPGHNLPESLYGEIETTSDLVSMLDTMQFNFLNHKKLLEGISF